MNWKVKLVLLFGRLRKPIDASTVPDIATLRKMSEKAARLGSKLFDKRIPVAKVTDVMAGYVPVRIYQNNNGDNNRVIIYYHGGGFVLYGLDSHDCVCRRLCSMNDCVVVSVDYRLAPEYTFPAAHEDAFKAILWVRENIINYGGDANNLMVGGDSAGGNLSACMAHRCKNEQIQLKAQILVYPWIDGKLNNPSIERNGKGYMLERETMFWFQAQYTPKKEDQCKPSVSPCYETDFTALAPAFVLTAQYDPLIDDGYNYYLQLKQAGNKALYKEYPELFHGFFNLPAMDKNALQAYKDIAEFIGKK
jgi:acetyl esterase